MTPQLQSHIREIYSRGLYVYPAWGGGKSLKGVNYRELANNPPSLDEALAQDYSGGLLILSGTQYKDTPSRVLSLDIDSGPETWQDWPGLPWHTIYAEGGTRAGSWHLFVLATYESLDGPSIINLRDSDNNLVAEMKGYGQVGLRSWPTIPDGKEKGYTPYYDTVKMPAQGEASRAVPTVQQWAEGIASFLSSYPTSRQVAIESPRGPRAISTATNTELLPAGKELVQTIVDTLAARGHRPKSPGATGWMKLAGPCVFCGHRGTMSINQRGSYNCFHAECQVHGGILALAQELGINTSGKAIFKANIGIRVDTPFPNSNVTPGPDDDGAWEDLLDMDGPEDENEDMVLVGPRVSTELIQEAKERAAARYPYSHASEDRPYVIAVMSMPKAGGGQMRRTQVMSNSWINPTNRQAKKRQAFVTYWTRFLQEESIHALDLPMDDWDQTEIGSRLSTLSKTNKGHHIYFDLGTQHGVWRILTTYPFHFKRGRSKTHHAWHSTEVAVDKESMAEFLLDTIDSIDPGPYDSSKKRRRFYWTCHDWAIVRPKDNDRFQVVAVKDGEADDDAEVEIAERLGFATEAREAVDDGDYVGWGVERWFFAKDSGESAVGTEYALIEMVANRFSGYTLTDKAFAMLHGDEALKEKKEAMAAARARTKRGG